MYFISLLPSIITHLIISFSLDIFHIPQVRYKNSFIVLIELKNLECHRIIYLPHTSILLSDMFDRCKSFQTIRHLNDSSAIIYKDNGRIMISTYREHFLKSIPWIFIDMLITHSALSFIFIYLDT